MSRLGARLHVLRHLVWRGLKSCGQPRQRPGEVRRILVLHHLLLGDTLMLTPLLAKLAARYPAAERFLACPHALVPLYAERPYGIQAIPWQPRTQQGLAALFAQAPYDLVIIPAENRYSPLVRALGARWVVGFADDQPAWKNWWLDEAHAFPAQPAAFGDFCATLVGGTAPAPYRPQDWPLPAGQDFVRPAEPYAVLHLGASTPLKYWDSARWMALASWLHARGITPVWSGGAKETGLVAQADPAGQFHSFAGQLDLAQLARLFAHAKLIVCPDTGITHLARIVGTPTVALFGPGSSLVSGAGEFWRDSPFIAISADVPCRDQDITFRRHADWIRRCARGFGNAAHQCAHPRCMEGIPLEAVTTACSQLLGQPTGPAVTQLLPWPSPR